VALPVSNGMKFNWTKSIGYILAIVLVVALIYSLFGHNGDAPQSIPLTDVIGMVDAGRVDKIIVSGEELTVITTDGQEFVSRKEQGVSLKDSGVNVNRVEVEIVDDQAGALWIGFFTSFLPFLLIFGFLWFMFRQAQGAGSQAMSFGKSKARLMVGTKHKVTFKDVAGSQEAKQELLWVVEFFPAPVKHSWLRRWQGRPTFPSLIFQVANL